MNYNDFLYIDEVWRHSWDEEVGTVLPKSVTDEAIGASRNFSPDRMIVHYMQPHFPSIGKPIGSEMDLDTLNWDWSVWNQLKRGEVDRQTVWESYRENLLCLLQDIHTLSENVNADEFVLTADHGNAVGEHGYFGHSNTPVKEVKNVPKYTVTTADSGAYEPKTEPTLNENTAVTIEERLRSLGYVD